MVRHERTGSGFLLDSASFRPLLGPRSFGNDGAGGQFAFWGDEFGVGFAYVADRMVGHGDDPRQPADHGAPFVSGR